MPKVTPSRVVTAEIRAEMGRQGVTGRELARRLGKDQSWTTRTIGVRAKQPITVDEVLEIAEALNVSAQGFLSVLLPRLDSNQQPSGYQRLGAVVDLFSGERVA